MSAREFIFVEAIIGSSLYDCIEIILSITYSSCNINILDFETCIWKLQQKCVAKLI